VKINTLNIHGNSISDHQEIADAFNKYFLTVATSVNTKQNELSSHNIDNTTPSLFNAVFQEFFPKY